jgi:serine/threonine protein kinase
LADGPEKFGKYELQARIAAGGMAEIYRARFSPAPGVTKQVVIKRILPHYAANKAFIQMFTNEAKIAIGLSHGNIAQVFDFGEIDGDWFLAMELVDGQPLSKVMKRARTLEIGVMPTPFAVLIGIEMLRGLHYAHTRIDEQGRPLKIVHRDVSPQNILIAYEGQVKIVDFGIAKARTAGRDETEAGAVKGKYAYFAPEQARAKELDARTDIFAAGIVLYEMLCGQLPFQGKMIEVLSKIVRGEFPRPRELNPEITPALEKIMLTAMAHEKADRYQTAEDFQQALSAYLYQNAPSFAPSGLGMFMGLLFEEELVAEGRPIQLPRDFLDQISLWKGAMPAVPKASDLPSHETRSGRSPDKKRKSAVDSEVVQESWTGAHFKAVPRWVRPLLFTAIPLLAALLTGIGVLSYARWSTFSVQLSSSPSNALVRVDGLAETHTTPVLLADLSASKPHELEVTWPGYYPGIRRVIPRRGEVLSEFVELRPIPIDAPAEPPVEAVVVDAGAVEAPRPDPIAVEASYPINDFTLHAKVHAFLVPPSKAARLRLNPKKSYRVWTEGKVAFGGYLDPQFDECVYFLEAAPGLKASETFGIIGPKGTVVKNANAIYAFLTDDKPADNTGAIKLRVMDVATHATSTVLVDSKSNALLPDSSGQFRLKGLEPLETYELKVKEGKRGARTLGDKGGRVGKVLLVQVPGLGHVMQGKQMANDATRVIEVGKTVRFSGTPWIYLSFPDDGLDDNDGTMQVEITALPGGTNLLKGLLPR